MPDDAPTIQPLPPGRFVVIKVGGRAMEDAAGLAGLAEGIAALRDAGFRTVVVHGGGTQVSEAMERAGLQPEFRDGLRVTAPEALAVAEPVFAAVGKRLSGALTASGAPAVALTGRDAALLTAVPRVGLGRVGAMTAVDGDLLRFLAFNGLTPVVGPPAVEAGGDPLNVNADEIASAVARALQAAALLLLTDVPGVLDASGSPRPHLTAGEARLLVAGEVAGGMVPKLQAALAAVDEGVARVHIAHAATALPDLVAGRGGGTCIVGGEG